jgi:hypothetical protein
MTRAVHAKGTVHVTSWGRDHAIGAGTSTDRGDGDVSYRHQVLHEISVIHQVPGTQPAVDVTETTKRGRYLAVRWNHRPWTCHPSAARGDYEIAQGMKHIPGMVLIPSES